MDGCPDTATATSDSHSPSDLSERLHGLVLDSVSFMTVLETVLEDAFPFAGNEDDRFGGTPMPNYKRYLCTDDQVDSVYFIREQLRDKLQELHALSRSLVEAVPRSRRAARPSSKSENSDA